MIEFDQRPQKMVKRSIRFTPGLWAEVMSFAKVNGVDESKAIRALVRTSLHLPEKASKARGSKS